MTKTPRGIVVGGGMLARAFLTLSTADNGRSCFFASGVSNSACDDVGQFARERELLLETLERHRAAEAFVYFGTCAADVPGNDSSPYVIHKVAMEALVLAHPNGHVARLPQVAGPNASPYTLLSALCSRIKSGQPVVIREHATRNIIDVVDVVRLVDAWLMEPDHARRINVANTRSYPVVTIVDTIESVLGIKGVREMVATGEPYDVDTSAIAPLMVSQGITFDQGYLASIIARYYA